MTFEEVVRQTTDWLNKDYTVHLTLDTRSQGVLVPEFLARAGVGVLAWGTRLTPPIRGFCITSNGVSGYLSFSGQESFCFVPWTAVRRAQLVDPVHLTSTTAKSIRPNTPNRKPKRVLPKGWQVIKGGRA